MALVLLDRAKETTIVLGTTASAILLGAATNYQSFAGVGNANTTYYCIAEQVGTNWEIGLGTYTSATTIITRAATPLSSSNAGASVSFPAGTKDIFIVYPSAKGVWLDASGNAIGLGTPAALVGTNITGTATAFTASNVTTNANLTGAVTSVGNASSLGSFTSAQLATALTDETGTGASVFATSPTLTTPTINSAQVPTISGTAPLYMCRAWVNFNGTGTVAIRASGNVSSITDNAVGDYTVNFTTAMPDANYSCVGSVSTEGIHGAIVFQPQTTAPTTIAAPLTTSIRCNVSAAAVGPVDSPYNNVSVFR